MNIHKHMLILLWLLVLTWAKNYTRQTCTSSQIFDTTNLACVGCPTNMRPNPNQPIPTSCVCNKGYYPTSATSCAYLGTTATVCSSHEYFAAISDDGVYTGASTYTCQACDNKAHSNMYKSRYTK